MTWSQVWVSYQQHTLGTLRGSFRWNGRSCRVEYGWWALTLFVLCAMTLASGGLMAVLVLASVPASLSLVVRRFHDVSRPTWWALLLAILPGVGALAGMSLLVMSIAAAFSNQSLYAASLTWPAIVMVVLGAMALLAHLVIALQPGTGAPTQWDAGYRPCRCDEVAAAG
jgi:uncharacterized membrane protein YhaH (DUF805 family)